MVISLMRMMMMIRMMRMVMMIWPVPGTGNIAESPLELGWNTAKSVDVGSNFLLQPGQRSRSCGAWLRGGALGGPRVGVTWGRRRQVWKKLTGWGGVGGGALVLGVCGAGDGHSVHPLIRKPHIRAGDLGDWPGPLILCTANSISHQPLIQCDLGWWINIVTGLCSL